MGSANEKPKSRSKSGTRPPVASRGKGLCASWRQLNIFLRGPRASNALLLNGLWRMLHKALHIIQTLNPLSQRPLPPPRSSSPITSCRPARWLAAPAGATGIALLAMWLGSSSSVNRVQQMAAAYMLRGRGVQIQAVLDQCGVSSTNSSNARYEGARSSPTTLTPAGMPL